MTSRGPGKRPLEVFKQGMTLALALFLVAPEMLMNMSRAASPVRTTRVPTIYHKSRSFRIPFNVDQVNRPRLKQVQLWVSEDSGFTWAPRSRTTPDRPAFTFRAARDGEYWFAVRTLDNKGQLFPGEEEKVEPSMKVVVDTAPPSLVLEPDGRRGSLASVRWEVRDAHLDLKSLVIEYQVEGAREWRSVPIRRPSLIGSENWDAGTAEPLKVRASVGDRAGNVAETEISISEGTPALPGTTATAADSSEFASSPPISQISSGPSLPSRDHAPVASAEPGNDPFPFPAGDVVPGVANRPQRAATTNVNEPDHFDGNSSQPQVASEPAPAAPAAPTAPTNPAENSAPGQPLLVSSPRFPLQYAVEDAGPNGPAGVDLWITQDGGRTWFHRGEDADRLSPFPVDLGGEGTFGLRLVARSASGLGDPAPAPGDRPDVVVEVDSTPPSVQLTTPKVGTGPNAGKVAILWRATDIHLSPRPIVLSWRPEASGSQWQPIGEAMENTGKFIWTVPTNLPARFHLRVDVVDTAGNRGYAETTEGTPVVIDRTRPRGRIIGLDPSARAGMGSRPLR